MNISIGNNHKQIINPIWSIKASKKSLTTTNVWPIRHHCYFRRFYNNPKTRRGHDNDSHFTTSTSINTDLDEYNKQKSQSLVTFCSTSRVKYIPLTGWSPDSLTLFKYTDPGPSLLPRISRPAIRPIILHGKRYTVLTSDEEIYYKDEDKLSVKNDQSSEQRRRFHESERNKINVKMYKENSELSGCGVRRSYCLSGRKITGRYNFQNDQPLSTLIRQNNIKNDFDIIIDSTPSDVYQTGQQIVTSSEFKDRDKVQMPHNTSNDCIISGYIVSNGGTERESTVVRSRVTDALKRAVDKLANVDPHDQSFKRANEMLLAILKDMRDISKCVTISSLDDVQECSRFIQPEVTEIADNTDLISLFETHIDLDSSTTDEIETFLSKMFNNTMSDPELCYWIKVFEILKINSINSVMFAKITAVIRMFQNHRYPTELPSQLSLLKAYFWFDFFVKIFNFTGSGNDDDQLIPSLPDYLEIVAGIVVNRNVLDVEAKYKVIEKLISMVITQPQIVDQIMSEDGKCTGAIKISLLHLLDIIPWIFATHNDVFHRHLVLDDLATVLTSLDCLSDRRHL